MKYNVACVAEFVATIFSHFRGVGFRWLRDLSVGFWVLVFRPAELFRGFRFQGVGIWCRV